MSLGVSIEPDELPWLAARLAMGASVDAVATMSGKRSPAIRAAIDAGLLPREPERPAPAVTPLTAPSTPDGERPRIRYGRPAALSPQYRRLPALTFKPVPDHG